MLTPRCAQTPFSLVSQFRLDPKQQQREVCAQPVLSVMALTTLQTWRGLHSQRCDGQGDQHVSACAGAGGQQEQEEEQQSGQSGVTE